MWLFGRLIASIAVAVSGIQLSSQSISAFPNGEMKWFCASAILFAFVVVASGASRDQELQALRERLDKFENPEE